MANKSKVQSVEPDIADLVNGWLKSYGLDYKLEQASLNSEIDKALDEYHSKSGGKGGNRPDAKLLLKDKYGTFYPVLIEYKGYKDKLVKLDTDGIVDNKKDKNEPNYTNIKSYAVNGAIHYATNIYVFKVGEPHHAKNTVKFIDFSNDGYTRTNRKKASVNLRDTDHAKERYQEIADIVRFGKSELNIFTDKEYYEGKIDPENGADWNQSAPINTIPTLEDFKKTVSDYLAWEVSTLLKGKSSEDNERLGK